MLAWYLYHYLHSPHSPEWRGVCVWDRHPQGGCIEWWLDICAQGKFRLILLCSISQETFIVFVEYVQRINYAVRWYIYILGACTGLLILKWSVCVLQWDILVYKPSLCCMMPPSTCCLHFKTTNGTGKVFIGWLFLTLQETRVDMFFSTLITSGGSWLRAKMSVLGAQLYLTLT